MMNKQLLWRDMDEGNELASMKKKTSTKQVVMWAGAVDQYGETHYDKDFALSRGLQGVIVHGSMKGAYLMQLLTENKGHDVQLKRIKWTDKKMDFVGKPMTYKARVTRKYIEDNEALLDCDIWIENEENEKTSEGTATIAIPQVLPIHK